MAIFNDDYSEIDVELLLFNNIVVGKLNKTSGFFEPMSVFASIFRLKIHEFDLEMFEIR